VTAGNWLKKLSKSQDDKRKQAEAELREAYRVMEERVKIGTPELVAEISTRKMTEDP
jgi:hypothetical protein